MSDVYFYQEIYRIGKERGLFKSISNGSQNLQVADFYSPAGAIDIHLTYDPKPITSNKKNLHITVRYRGVYSNDAGRVNDINIKNGTYQKRKIAPSFSFYLKTIKIGKNQRIELIDKNDPHLKDTRVNIQGYIDRINFLLSNE